MSFLRPKSPQFSFFTFVNDLVERNRRFIDEDWTPALTASALTEKGMQVPFLPLEILGCEVVRFESASAAVIAPNRTGYAQVTLSLFSDGSPYVPEQDFANGSEDNWYEICAGQDGMPFLISSEYVDDEFSGFTNRYVTDQIARGERLHAVRDDQLEAVMGYLTLIEEEFKQTG